MTTDITVLSDLTSTLLPSSNTLITITSAGAITPIIYGTDGLYVAAGLTGVAIINRGSIIGDNSTILQAADGFAGGVGVYLRNGQLSNYGVVAGGSSHSVGVYIGGAGGNGVDLSTGGLLTNHGAIAAGNANNALYRGGAGGVGVDLSHGGVLSNTASAIISGGTGGYGHAVGGVGGNGVNVGDGGSVTNYGVIKGGNGGTSATVAGVGGAGVYINNGTLYNIGTINAGQSGVAVQFGTLAGTLVVAAGAKFSGKVIANTGVADVLKLAGAGTQGTIGNIGSQFYGFSSIIETYGSDWNIDLTNSMIAAEKLSIGGIFDVSGKFVDAGVAQLAFSGTIAPTGTGLVEIKTINASGGLLEGDSSGTFVIGTSTTGATTGEIFIATTGTIGGKGTIAGAPLVDNGVIAVKGGTMTLATATSGTGSITIAASSTLAASAALNVAKISFATAGTLDLAIPSGFTGTISGFSTGDVINLSAITATSLSFAGTSLSVLNGTTTVDQITFSGKLTTASFAETSDGHGGTLISFV